MIKSFSSLSVMVAIVMLAGCATSRSALDIQAPTSQVAPSNGKQVFINVAMDDRSFQDDPKSPNIPSLDPSETGGNAIKHRAIGRKRNGFGKALGDIVLKDGQTVQSVTTHAIKQAFIESGYTVVADKNQVGPNTYIVNANIEKFWAWMNPGFASITLSSEIATDISIKSPASDAKKEVYAKATGSYQFATESNWTEIVDRALRLYIDDLKAKLQK